MIRRLQYNMSRSGGDDGAGGEDDDDAMISLCLTAAPNQPPPPHGPPAPQSSRRRVVLTVSAINTTVEQLHERAAATMGLTNQRASVQLQVGFPLRTLPSDSTESLQEAGIQNQERIVVTERQPHPQHATTKTATTKASPATTDAAAAAAAASPATTPSGGPKRRRQAAIAATESMASAIRRQQNEEAAAAKSTPNKRRRNATGTTSLAAAPQSLPRKLSSASRHFAALTRHGGDEGRRLRDGAAAPRKRSTAPSAVKGASTTSVAEGLVAAAANDASSAGARLMRTRWRQAVHSAYEQNQAACRVAAAPMADDPDRVTFQVVWMDDDQERPPPQQQQQAHNGNQMLKITYPKGVQGRGKFVDVVSYLPVDVLVAAVRAIHPAEALRSSNLALLSPRVFWSLVYHYYQPQQQQEKQTVLPRPRQGDVVHQALQWSCPHLDWSFLRRRPQQLSAKALENLRQQEQHQHSSTEDWEAAAAAIAAVEQAMADMPSLVSGKKAFLETIEETDADSDWQVVTPSELDWDELKECVLSYESSSSAVENDVSCALEEVVGVLSEDLHQNNWRELANCNDATALCELLLAALEERKKKAAVPFGSSTEDIGNKAKTVVPVCVAAVQAWLDHAQLQSMEEIMVEICDGNVEAVELLRDSARSGTPKDLTGWQSIVGTLHHHLVAAANTEHKSDLSGAVVALPDKQEIRKWCNRARRAMEQLEWLNWYATPID